MGRVKCRCGEILDVPADAAERLKCPRCGAKIRVRRPGEGGKAGAGDAGAGDGYIRFPCPCGRRLKVRAADRPEAGKCPDCGRVVPVPDSAYADDGDAPRPSPQGGYGASAPEGPRTADMDAYDLGELEEWAKRFQEPPAPAPAPAPAVAPVAAAVAVAPLPSPLTPTPVSGAKMEAGLRVCSRCGKPLHMSATVCRSCGEPAPRR